MIGDHLFFMESVESHKRTMKKYITSHWSERVPQVTFSGSIVMRSSNRFGGMLLSYSGTRHSILRSIHLVLVPLLLVNLFKLTK